MKREDLLCEVIENKPVAKDIFTMVFKSEEIAKEASAGQFVNIKCGENTYLRRPISICETFGDSVRINYSVVGKGTLFLSEIIPGQTIDVMGALGNSFSIFEKYKKPLLVGGGAGIYPLYFLSKSIQNAIVALGFKNREYVNMESEFIKTCKEVLVSTDDGSYKNKGVVSSLFNIEDYDVIYACGPKPMLKAVCDMANKSGIHCEVSMEERMGCGIGACKVCACKTKSREGMNFDYSHVCLDGPVFFSNEVIFDD